MSYEVKRFDDVFSKIDQGDVLIDNRSVCIQTYSLKATTYLHNWFKEVDRDNDSEAHFLVLEGEIEVQFSETKKRLAAGEMVSIYHQENFTILAVSDCKLISVNNMVSRDIENYGEVQAMILEAENHDVYLRGHNGRVGAYTSHIMRLAVPDYSGAFPNLAAAMHDVGKIRINPAILNKPGKLTEEEFAEIKKHPVYSYEILKKLVHPRVAEFARWHHERPDGTGYPDGLKGDQIPLGCLAIAVADVFDALTTSRSYRKAYSFKEALAIMAEEVEQNHLDRRFYNALVQLVETGMIKEGVDNTGTGADIWN